VIRLFKDLKNTMVFLKGHYLEYYSGIIGMTLLYASTAILESYLIKRLLNLNSKVNMEVIMYITGAVLIYLILIWKFLPKFTFMFNGTAKYGHGNVNKVIYGKFGKIPVGYYEKNHSGKIMSVLYNDSWVLSVIFMRHLRRTVASLTTIIIYLVPMLLFDYRLTCIIFVLNILTLWVNTSIAKKMRARSKTIQNELANMNATISDILSGMSVIRIYHQAKRMEADFKKNNKVVSHLNKRNSKTTAFLTSYIFLVSMIQMTVFLVLGTIMVQYKLTTFGDILGIMSLQTALDLNFREFAEYFPQLYNCLAGTERVYEFLDLEEEKKAYPLDRMDEPGYIEFRNVTFGYDKENPVLTDFNMKVNKGQTFAIVGESGSGKSSVAKLLMGFYMPQSGSISIAGKNISDMTLEEMRGQVSYVPQEAMLFGVSIMDNIRYGKSDATDDEVVEAAKSANAHDFILEQENGYETQVGERGIRLSGGQCQRIAIARAILKNAPILLLDEATSALDTESERLIKETLRNYGKTRTTIIIAHRLSTIENADQVFQLGAIGSK